MRYGDFLVRGIKGWVFDIEADDLLQEAIARTLTGNRQWNRQVTMFTHLFGCMRSIADERAKRAKLGGTKREDLPKDVHKERFPGDAIRYEPIQARFTELSDSHPSKEEMHRTDLS
jgi:hypothetical protein